MAKVLSTKSQKTINYLRSYWTLYLMLLLPIAYFVIFRYIPMTYIQIAFKRVQPFPERLGDAVGGQRRL